MDCFHLYYLFTSYERLKVNYILSTESKVSLLIEMQIKLVVPFMITDASAAAASGLSFIFLVYLLGILQFAGQMAAEIETVVSLVLE